MYVSRRAVIKTSLLAPDVLVFGPSTVGEETILDRGVIVGYPMRRSIRSNLPWNERLYLLYDEVSSGASIGRKVHLRPGTVVYEKVSIGDGVETGHNVLIREETVIGEGTVIGTSTIIDGRVRIGRNARIETGVYIPPETTIGDNVFLGPFVVITNDRYPMSSRLKGPIIEDGAVIGANAVIVAGVRIGRGAVVAAGAIVTRDVEPETVVVGTPAKPRISLKEYLEKKKAWEEGR